MKRINLILCFILMNVAIWAQKVDGAGNNIDPYVGTWVYQSNDTIFKIVFRKVEKFHDTLKPMVFTADIIFP